MPSLLSSLIKKDYIYGDDNKRKRKQSRRPKYKFQRLDMEKHYEMCRHTLGFQRQYHMSEASFSRLVKILRPQLQVNEHQSRRSTGKNDPITAKITLAIGLRYMGGEN